MGTQTHKAGSWITVAYQVEEEIDDKQARELIQQNSPSGVSFRDMRVFDTEPKLSLLGSGQ